jgi:hypothetical protein
VFANELGRIRNENLVYLDETGFNEHRRRRYGYSPINTKAYITVPGNRNQNKSLMFAFGVNGLIEYEHKLGAYNSVRF